MTESVEIRRLRRLLGAQKFEEEAIKGRETQSSAEKELAFGAAIARHFAANGEGAQTAEGYQSARNEKADRFAEARRIAQQQAKAQAVANLDRDRLDKAKKSSRQPEQAMLDPASASGWTAPWDESDSDFDDPYYTIGQETEPGQTFCPILAVSKYPYKYLKVEKDTMEKVASAQFNNGKFWERKWTIYYIPLPITISSAPLFCVPATEVHALLQEVHQQTGVKTEFPKGHNGVGFLLNFSAKEPRPRYLGISRSRPDFESMESRVPALHLNGAFALAEEGDDKSFEAWKSRMEAAVQAAKNKKTKSKAGAKEYRMASKQQWWRQLRRAQRYLGLRTTNPKEAKGAQGKLLPHEENAVFDGEDYDDPEHPPALDVTKPPQFPFDEDVVFVCIDLEANERAASMITEIGVATLDTRVLKDAAPGPMAENWRSLVRYRHFRIEEYKEHRNTEFLVGCPERFEKDLGKSEFIRKAEIPKVMAASCKPPFPVTATERAAASGASMYADKPELDERKLVLVGHNIDSDIGYLRSAGFEVLKLNGLVEVQDTGMIAKAFRQDSQAISLGNLLYELHITGWNLHNAGNDAAYTLQALLAMAVTNLTEGEHLELEKKRARRREEAIRLATARVDDDMAEWLHLKS